MSELHPSTDPWFQTYDRGPVTVTFTVSGCVARAEPPHAKLYVEMESADAARCSFQWESDTPVKITVHKPHDRELVQEATEVLAALYWSRWRVAVGD